MNPIEQLTAIVPTLCTTVDHIEPMQMNDPTPCSAFTVHDVLDHMIMLGGSFSHAFRGEVAPEQRAPAVYGRVPNAEFKDAMHELLEAVRSPGAMERVISTPMGDVPGETFARFVALDGLLHGWDLASSTGQSFDVPDALTAAVDEFARVALTPDMRDGDTFKGQTTAPEDASSLDRLAAFSGRSL